MIVTRGWSPSSHAEAQKTLKQMSRNVRAALSDGRVLATARRIVERVGERDETGQARAVREWTAARFKFVKDPCGVEMLLTPAYQLARIAERGKVQGDCDDAAAITAALNMALGIPCTFRALAFSKAGPWAHVYTVAQPLDARQGKRVAVDMDITRPKDLRSPVIARTLTTRA